MGVNALGSALSQTLQQSPGAVTQSPIGQQNAQMLAGELVCQQPQHQ